MIFCLLPRELAPRLERTMERFAEEQGGIRLIVDCRGRERRRSGERRQDEFPIAPEGDDRRIVHNADGRRVAERRATLVPVRAPGPLPRRARIVADRIVFAERLDATAEHIEDLDTARLVTRIQAGDEAGFGALYTRYFDRVYAYLRIALNDRHEAEDATQQVFVQVLEALPDFELRAAPFRAWLFRIVRNNAIKHLAKHQRIEVEDPDVLDRRRDMARESGDMHVLSWLEDGELLILIERMPLAQRQVMLLRYMMDLSCPEIAAILGRSPDAIRQLQHRALTFLRGRLTALGLEPKTASAPMPMRSLFPRSRVLGARRLALRAG